MNSMYNSPSLTEFSKSQKIDCKIKQEECVYKIKKRVELWHNSVHLCLQSSGMIRRSYQLISSIHSDARRPVTTKRGHKVQKASLCYGYNNTFDVLTKGAAVSGVHGINKWYMKLFHK
jgi:hypothetical protein